MDRAETFYVTVEIWDPKQRRRVLYFVDADNQMVNSPDRAKLWSHRAAVITVELYRRAYRTAECNIHRSDNLNLEGATLASSDYYS